MISLFYSTVLFWEIMFQAFIDSSETKQVATQPTLLLKENCEISSLPHILTQ